MRKLRVKLRNASIYHPWDPVFKKYFFQKRTPPSSEMLDLLRRWHLNRIEETNQGYFKSGALKVTILRKVSRCFAFSTKWVGNHFYMAKWTLIFSHKWKLLCHLSGFNKVMVILKVPRYLMMSHAWSKVEVDKPE